MAALFSVQYNSLGRLLTATNLENGTVNYAYDKTPANGDGPDAGNLQDAVQLLAALDAEGEEEE